MWELHVFALRRILSSHWRLLWDFSVRLSAESRSKILRSMKNSLQMVQHNVSHLLSMEVGCGEVMSVYGIVTFDLNIFLFLSIYLHVLYSNSATQEVCIVICFTFFFFYMVGNSITDITPSTTLCLGGFNFSCSSKPSPRMRSRKKWASPAKLRNTEVLPRQRGGARRPSTNEMPGLE